MFAICCSMRSTHSSFIASTGEEGLLEDELLSELLEDEDAMAPGGP